MRNLLDFLLKYNYWFLFIILEVISFALLFRFNNYQGSAFFASSNALVGGVYDLAGQVTGYFRLKGINDALVQENVELRLQNNMLRETLQSISPDSLALGSLNQDALESYHIYKAKVINNSLAYSDNYLTLDKGDKDGIKSEMGVVDGNGIVGIVYQTSAHYSVVMSLLNSKSNISCKVKHSDYFGFLNWDGKSSQYAVVRDMPRHSVVSLGDTIVTSGHSAIFPSGMPIGVVNDISDSNDGLSYHIKIMLFTDYGRLKDVRVIERKGRQEQMELEQQVKKRK